MSFRGNSGSLMDLLFKGNMCRFGNSGLITELLFTVNMILRRITVSFTELVLSLETYVGVVAVVHLRNFSYLIKYVMVWG
jgi:hypothetical protein